MFLGCACNADHPAGRSTRLTNAVCSFRCRTCWYCPVCYPPPLLTVKIPRGVMHGLPVLEQEVGSAVGSDSDSGSAQEESPQAAGSEQAGWGLGGTGPVLKTQTIVSAIGMRPGFSFFTRSCVRVDRVEGLDGTQVCRVHGRRKCMAAVCNLKARGRLVEPLRFLAAQQSRSSPTRVYVTTRSLIPPLFSPPFISDVHSVLI